MIFKDLTLDKFQEDAVDAIESNHSVLVSAPTGSGKTLIADYVIDKYLKEGKQIIYTAPIKALSNFIVGIKVDFKIAIKSCLYRNGTII